MTTLEEQLEASVRQQQIKQNISAIQLVRPQSAIVVQGHAALSFTEEQERMIRDQFAPGSTADEFAMLIEICRVRRLDPRLRQVYLVKRWDKSRGREVWAVQVSIDGMRAIAERTGLYNGQDEPEFGPKNAKGFPEFAKVKIYRKGWDRPAVGFAYWAEYVQMKEGRPTKFWADMPHNQIAKCAEANALRKAFPEDCGGLYTDVEMEQASNAPRPAQEYIPATGGAANDQGDARRYPPKITPHGSDEEEMGEPPTPESIELFEALLERLQTIENSIAGCEDYDGATILRDLLGGIGSRNVESIARDCQRARDQGKIWPSQNQVLSKAWRRCHYQLSKLEKEFAPDVTDSFRDE